MGSTSPHEQHNWSGTSDTMVVDGEVVEKSPRVVPFVVLTGFVFLGLYLIVRSAQTSFPLHLLGVALALVATVASYRYRYYSHWLGLAVVLVIAGSLVMRLMTALPS